MSRIIIPLLVIAAIIIFTDLYSYQAVRSATRDMSVNGRRAVQIAYWALSLIAISTIIVGFLTDFRTWPPLLKGLLVSSVMVIIVSKLFVVFFLVLEDLIRLFNWLFQKMAHSSTTSDGIEAATQGMSRSKFFGQLALLAGGVPLMVGLWGVFRNAYNYKVHRITVKLPNLPDSFEGLKIVQISDIHSGSFTSKSAVERGIELINEQDADVVFFTGDIVNTYAEEMLEWIDTFKQVKAKEGVYSVIGNHDYGHYGNYGSEEEKKKKQASNRELIKKVHADMGWDLMLNEHRKLQRGADEIAIIGVENWSDRKYFPSTGDLKVASAGTENSAVKLLLSHDPTHFDAEVKKEYKDIDITFSGHTHGAQMGIEIPGFIKWSPSQWMYQKWAGLYSEGDQHLYVNRGFGFLGFHGRIGILPEITVMELKKV